MRPLLGAGSTQRAKYELLNGHDLIIENVKLTIDVGRLGDSSIHEYAEIGSIVAENPSHALQCREPESN